MDDGTQRWSGGKLPSEHEREIIEARRAHRRAARSFAEFAAEKKAEWNEEARAVYDAATEAFESGISKHSASVHGGNYLVERALDEWVATCTGYPSMSWVAATPVEALAGLIRAVREVIEDLKDETDG